MRAYLLVKFAHDADLSNASHALRRPGIASVDLVMGPYDAIVVCEAADFAALQDLSTAVRGCPGILDSMTCPVISAGAE